MPVRDGISRLQKERERGQVLVLVALLVPLFLAIGSIVIDVGNWYVLKRHLQTQVDAAALAGGPAFTGCFQNPLAARDAIAQQALAFAGDPTRDPAAHNPLMQDTADVHAVLNSSTFWTQGELPGATDWTDGMPCDTKFLDVKATDDEAPLLWRWIPFFPDLKTRARVEVTEIRSSSGMMPLGVPELDPTHVAVLVVDEDGDPALPGTIVGKSPLDLQTTPPAALADMSVWSRDFIAGVNLSGDTDFDVIIVASRSPINLSQSLSQICSPASGQVECYGGGDSDDGISFIHAYSTAGTASATNPIVRGVSLSDGCAADLSKPYFNFEGGCPLTITAEVDFGTGSSNPVPDAAGGGVCAKVSSPQVQGSGQLSWAGGFWTGTVDPAADGPTTVTLSWSTDTVGNCGGTGGDSGTFGKVAEPYAGDAASGPVQYLTVKTAGGAGFANSIAQNPAASLQVTVGFTPPLRENQLTDPPIVLRGWNQPSQSQALDCNASGASGWADAMDNGCTDPYQIYDQSKHTTKCGPPPNGVPPADPKDCIDSETGNFQENKVQDIFTPCADHPNRWDGTNIPPLDDERWMPLFILDQMAFEVSGKRTYPIRRFGMFYITAVSGLNCPGDVPNPVPNGKREIWGHFKSFVTPGLGATIPSDTPCSFGNGTLCVSNLVE
jgi:Putative Flp pilus-assembly TadE/G-like